MFYVESVVSLSFPKLSFCMFLLVFFYIHLIHSQALDEATVRWSIPEDPCSYSGTSVCENHYKVISINYKGLHLSGPLPTHLFTFSHLQSLDISFNDFSSSIPNELGLLTNLEVLQLSHNMFEGSIPNSIVNLKHLQTLDLSSNHLSGRLNVSALKMLKELKYLNLSHNKFSGKILESDVKNWSVPLYLDGNSGLCGPKALGLLPCPSKKNYVMTKVVPVIIALVGFLLCCLLVGIFWKKYYSKKPSEIPPLGSQMYSSQSFTNQRFRHRRISYEELANATNDFDESMLIGKGSFGSVYKGILSDGETIAIKVLDLETHQAEKSFKTECKVLVETKHRNLLRIMTVCSSPHFKALVYEYISNGSLDDVLHRSNESSDLGQSLGLEKTLQIAIDIANALEYLHHDCPVKIVHCDIKPCNVLLDDTMTARVADFGIARLVSGSSSSSNSHTITAKGSIGYIAPEYGMGEKVSILGDVYSFGVLLLEMLTRKRPNDAMFVGDLSLHKWVKMAYPHSLENVVHRSLITETLTDAGKMHSCISEMVNTGLLCSQEAPQNRPNMKEVTIMLQNHNK